MMQSKSGSILRGMNPFRVAASFVPAPGRDWIVDGYGADLFSLWLCSLPPGENQMETVDRLPSVAVRIDPEPDHSFLSLLSPPISEDFWSRKKFDWSLELSVASYTRDPSRIKLSGSILAGFPETRAWMGFLLKSPNKSVRFHVRFLIRNGVSSTPILRLSAWIDPAPSWWSGYEIRHLDQRQLYGQRIKTWCVIWNSDEIRSSCSQSGSILPSRHFPSPPLPPIFTWEGASTLDIPGAVETLPLHHIIPSASSDSGSILPGTQPNLNPWLTRTGYETPFDPLSLILIHFLIFTLTLRPILGSILGSILGLILGAAIRTDPGRGNHLQRTRIQGMSSSTDRRINWTPCFFYYWINWINHSQFKPELLSLTISEKLDRIKSITQSGHRITCH